MAAACAHGPAKGGRGASAASSSAAGFWLSNGATSSSESNCNYVYIVADVAVALWTGCSNDTSMRGNVQLKGLLSHSAGNTDMTFTCTVPPSFGSEENESLCGS